MKGWWVVLTFTLLVACASSPGSNTTSGSEPGLTPTSTATSTSVAPPSSVDVLQEANIATYSRNTQPPPDYRNYVDFVKSVDLPNRAWNAVIGERLDRPDGLAIAFSCRQDENVDLVIASVTNDDIASIVDLISRYAEQEGCDTEGPGPPVQCLGLETDPVSCEEGDADGG